MVLDKNDWIGFVRDIGTSSSNDKKNSVLHVIRPSRNGLKA
jgi:hypothetical protein